jgi:hypothetical protein
MLTKISTKRIETLFNLPASGYELDWDIELANADRIHEFLEVYESVQLPPDDRFALMAILLASVDRYLEGDATPPVEWQQIASILVKESGLHDRTIQYWFYNPIPTIRIATRCSGGSVYSNW